MPPSLSTELLEAAARWHVQLTEQADNVAETQAWQTWLDADPAHRAAWARMQALAQRLGSVPQGLALPTLGTARAKRRRVLQLLTLLMSAGATGLAVHETQGLRTLVADYRTRTGERRQLQLADGSTLDINTASAVDVEYSDKLRRLRLYEGEILVRTAADAQRRPFEVETQQGRIVALGTHFSVRSEGNQTQVAVLEHAVELHPHNAQSVQRLEAGEQSEFTLHEVGPVVPADAAQAAWSSGKLVAIDQPLAHFLAELSRHRSGVLLCDPAVAELRLSGAFRLGDTDAILDNLTASLPVKVSYATRYWARVEPR